MTLGKVRASRRVGSGVFCVAAFALTTLTPRGAVASVESEGRPLSGPSKASDAKRHFQRGVELYEDGDPSGALAEFSRSYQILPVFRVLYNLGQLSFQRQEYVAALRYFRKYLADGGGQIAPERRKQVEQDIRRLEQRIGRIDVDAVDDGADIFVDDVSVAKTPVDEPVLVNVGRHKVAVASRVGARQVRWVDVAGGETTHVRFDTPNASAGLALGSRTGTPGAGAPSLLSAPRAVISEAALPPEEDEEEEEVTPPTKRGTWMAWAAAGILGAGAATTGVFAVSASRDLEQSRQSYPIEPTELESTGRRARMLAWTTDGLLVGTCLLTAWALYLTTH